MREAVTGLDHPTAGPHPTNVATVNTGRRPEGKTAPLVGAFSDTPGPVGPQLHDSEAPFSEQ